MTKDRPDWEETERRRAEWENEARERGCDWEWGVAPEWLRPGDFEVKVECITCHDFSSASPEIMALHALGCKQVELVSLAVVVEAELLLMAAYAERHGCGCPKHRPWTVA